MPNARLVELHARGLGVIDDARLEFGDGFNVITGETGAGKTLLLGALALCLGDDASAPRSAASPDLRAGAVFLTFDGREIALGREMAESGRLRATIDGAPTSAEALRAVAREVIVIHGQHDSLALRQRADVRAILDASADISTAALDAVRRDLADCRRRREGLGGDQGSRGREREYLEFQIAELEGAHVASAEELTEVLERLTQLSERRDAQAALAGILEELDGESDDAVFARLARAVDRLPRGVEFAGVADQLRGALAEARSATSELARMADPDSFDPETMSRLDDRAAELRTLARKYGGTLETAIATLVDLRSRRDVLDDATGQLEGLDARIGELAELERRCAEEVRRAREQAARALTAALARQLPRVALDRAALRFLVEGEDGGDVALLFTPGPGQPEGPLSALASGGELSRVLLALSLETVHQGVVAVFDEVDAGVGGQVAQQIGECLRELGRRQQVLAVTHLASVAAKADHHFVLAKGVEGEAATATVRRIEGPERVAEVARMLAGDVMSDESLALARRLLDSTAQ